MLGGPERISRGDFAPMVYRLGRGEATGILTIVVASGATEVLVLRRGSLCADQARAGIARLARLAGDSSLVAAFDGGVTAHPPVPVERTVPLAPWARRHLESQLDASRGEELTAVLAGARLSVRTELLPPPVMLDETDRRIIAAMAQPRRLDQIWPLARAPRFRLLCFLYFLRHVGALIEAGIGAFDSGPHRAASDPARLEAARILGVADLSDRDAIKRAYRRLARALHPDLQPQIAGDRRRELEHRLAEVAAAASTLLAR